MALARVVAGLLAAVHLPREEAASITWYLLPIICDLLSMIYYTTPHRPSPPRMALQPICSRGGWCTGEVSTLQAAHPHAGPLLEEKGPAAGGRHAVDQVLYVGTVGLGQRFAAAWVRVWATFGDG